MNKSFFSFLLFIALCAIKLAAQGDSCNLATIVTVNSSCNYISANVTIANTISGELPYAGPNLINKRDIWFTFQATSTYTLLKYKPSGLKKALIQVLSGSCGSLNEISYIGAINAGDSIQTIANTGIGTWYYVRIMKIGPGMDTINGDLCITTSAYPGPADNCANAKFLVPDTSGACNNIPASTNGFTASGELPYPTCNNMNVTDIWYKFIATAPVTVIEYDMGATGLPGESPIIQVLKGNCGSLTEVLCSGASPNYGYFKTVAWVSTIPADTYYVRIENWVSSNPINGTLCIYDHPTIPGDFCDTALIYTPVTNNCAPVFVNTLGYGPSGLFNTIPADWCGNNNGIIDVWFKFTATSNYTIAEFDPIDSSKAKVTMFAGSCNTLTVIACGDPGFVTDGRKSRAGSPTQLGQTYYVRIQNAGNIYNYGSNIPMKGNLCIYNESFVCNSTNYPNKKSNIWYFGHQAGLDFNCNPPLPLTNSQMNAHESMSSIADDNGNLLFYTDGEVVWDRNHNLMPNANGSSYNKTLLGGFSSTQGALITPVIGNKNKYYIFTVDGSSTSTLKGPKGRWDGLYYTVVDMSLNGGMGDIDTAFIRSQLGSAGNKIPLTDTTSEKLTAIKHGNGSAYWILTRKNFSSTYYAYLVNCQGVNGSTPVISNIGTIGATGQMDDGTGQLIATVDGKNIIEADYDDEVEMFDFDNCSGIVGNARIISSPALVRPYGAAVSSNDSLIYISGEGRIYQYQRFAPNVMATETRVFDGMTNGGGVPVGDEGMQLGPDGKIYISRGGYNPTSWMQKPSLSVIHQPNNLLNPYVEQHAIFLKGKGSGLGLPNIFNAYALTAPVAYAGTDKSICEGDSVLLGQDPVTCAAVYSWIPATGLSNTAISNPFAKPTATTTYSVIISSGACSDTASVTITVSPLPSLSVSSDTTICMGQSTTLTASGVTNYLWSGGETTSSILISPTSTTTYSIIGSNACGIDSSSIAINVALGPSIVMSPDTTICMGQGITLTASGSNSYAWLPGGQTISVITINPTASTSFTVIGTDSNNCSSTATSFVTVNAVPVSVITGSTNICEGSSTTLTSNGASSYTWSPYSGISSSTGAVVSANPTVSTTYSVIATGANGCTSLSVITVTVNSVPIANAGSDSAICEGESIILNASGGSNYQWFPLAGLSSTAINNPVANPITTTTYSVIISNGACSDTDSVMITVFPVPLANAGNNVTIFSGSSTMLSASGGNSYLWSPSAGLSCVTCENPIATPLLTTTYCVIITNSNGCTDTACVTVTVDIDCKTIYVPNAFSPDGSGSIENEMMCIYGINCISEASFSVYDRWGERVFETTDLEKCWDGFYKGEKMNTGVFVYRLQATLHNGEKITKIGNISLIK